MSDQQSGSQRLDALRNRSPGIFSTTWVWVPLILFGVAVLSKLPRTPSSLGSNSLANGKQAPNLDLVPLTDSTILTRIDRVPTGKVVLLHLWGTWCVPCTTEYPHVSAMVRNWEKSDRFQFIPVSCQSGNDESFDVLKQNTLDYFRTARISSYAYCDPYGVTLQSVARRLERDGIFFPTSILIQQDGSIAGVWEGFSETTVSQMHAAIGDLLNR